MEEKRKQKKSRDFATKIKEIEKERDEMLSAWQRCRADFLNYKKEEVERMKRIVEYEKEKWFLELLRVLDHFERAKIEVSKNSQDISLFDGFFQIQKSLEDFMKRQGTEEIEAQIGKKFDPNFEEVIEAEENEGEEGIILEVLQKGYKFRDKVIRPARVKVSKKVDKNINDN